MTAQIKKSATGLGTALLLGAVGCASAGTPEKAGQDLNAADAEDQSETTPPADEALDSGTGDTGMLDSEALCEIVGDRCQPTDPSVRCCTIFGARYRPDAACVEGNEGSRARELVACRADREEEAFVPNGAECDGATAVTCVERAEDDSGTAIFVLPTVQVTSQLIRCSEELSEMVSFAPACSP